MSLTDPEQLKGLGNTALQSGHFNEAVQFYTQALDLAKSQSKPCHVYYSNRSAAEMRRENYEQALEDALSCVAEKPDWPKGYNRKGAALSYLKRYAEAEATLTEGLKIAPNDAPMKQALAEVRENLTGPGNSQPMGSPFGDPKQIMAKLMANPETAEYMKDPAFVTMLNSLGQNPQNIMSMMNDPRMMKTFGVLTGIDMSGGPSGGASGDAPVDVPMDTSENLPKEPTEPEPKVEEMYEDDIDTEEKENKLQAANEKKLGTTAYLSKNFDVALKHYQAAIDLEPTNMIYYNNMAAVYMEQGQFDTCREYCNKAIDIGRENRADFKIISKAIARIGTSYERQDPNNPEAMQNSVHWYTKSLSENRDKDVIAKIKRIEKKLKEKTRLALIDPVKYETEKAEGNDLFKKGDYPAAILKYNSAISRSEPRDEKLSALYSNRAAAYSKLMEFNLCLSDCNSAIEINPKFMKAYLRKGTALEAMKRTSEAKQIFQKALGMEPSSVEAQQGYQRCTEKLYSTKNDPDEIKRRAQQDPEVMAILKDPSMCLILDQMQSDPNALKEHLKNPEVATKIQKLIDVGVIGVG